MPLPEGHAFPMDESPALCGIFRDEGVVAGSDIVEPVEAARDDLALEEADPDLVFYLGGVDVVAGDRFGRLVLTREGLEARDRMAIGMVLERGVPLALLLSGGYARTPREFADLPAAAHRVASAAGGAPRANAMPS